MSHSTLSRCILWSPWVHPLELMHHLTNFFRSEGASVYSIPSHYVLWMPVHLIVARDLSHLQVASKLHDRASEVVKDCSLRVSVFLPQSSNIGSSSLCSGHAFQWPLTKKLDFNWTCFAPPMMMNMKMKTSEKLMGKNWSGTRNKKGYQWSERIIYFVLNVVDLSLKHCLASRKVVGSIPAVLKRMFFMKTLSKCTCIKILMIGKLHM